MIKTTSLTTRQQRKYHPQNSTENFTVTNWNTCDNSTLSYGNNPRHWFGLPGILLWITNIGEISDFENFYTTRFDIAQVLQCWSICRGVFGSFYIIFSSCFNVFSYLKFVKFGVLFLKCWLIYFPNFSSIWHFPVVNCTFCGIIICIITF